MLVALAERFSLLVLLYSCLYTYITIWNILVLSMQQQTFLKEKNDLKLQGVPVSIWLFKTTYVSRVWWHSPVIPAIMEFEAEGSKFEARLNNLEARMSLK
jgi:hypothetical protein